MPTFVHTADIHFDTPFSVGFSQKQAELRRKEVMQTFGKICEHAKEMDLLFVAGDLFDGRFVSSETVAYVKRCFASIPDTRVFLVAGNHDPLTAESVYQTEDWGDNVHVFSTEMEYVDLPDLQTRIHGRSFSAAHEEKTLLSNLELAEDWCNLLLMHGEVVSTDGESRYNPIEKQNLKQSGLDYAALGHIHLYNGIERADDTYYAYPGIPEGRGFDETGARGYLFGTVEKGSLQAEWKPICKREFIRCEVDLSGFTDHLAITERLATVIKSKGEEKIYRLILTGNVEDTLVNPELLREELKEYCFSLELRDATCPSYSLEELRKEPGLRGAFVSAMLARIDAMSQEEKEIGNLALKLGLDAMGRGHL